MKTWWHLHLFASKQICNIWTIWIDWIWRWCFPSVLFHFLNIFCYSQFQLYSTCFLQLTIQFSCSQCLWLVYELRKSYSFWNRRNIGVFSSSLSICFVPTRSLKLISLISWGITNFSALMSVLLKKADHAFSIMIGFSFLWGLSGSRRKNSFFFWLKWEELSCWMVCYSIMC